MLALHDEYELRIWAKFPNSCYLLLGVKLKTTFLKLKIDHLISVRFYGDHDFFNMDADSLSNKFALFH